MALTAPVSSSWLTDCVRRHLPAGTAPDPVSLRESLEGRLTDARKARGKRHPLASLVSGLVAGGAAAGSGALAGAQAAAGAGRAGGSRARSRTPGRGGGRQGAQGRQGRREEESAPARRRHPRPRDRDRTGQGRAIRQGRRDQPLQAAAGPAAAGRDRCHQRRHAGEQGQRAVPAESEERALPVARPGQPADAGRDPDALPWENAPVAAATSETARGRIETRTIRVLPAPAGTGFEGASQAILIERYTTHKKKGQWRTSCEAVLCITSLAAGEATPEGLLAHVRGHWRARHPPPPPPPTWHE